MFLLEDFCPPRSQDYWKLLGYLKKTHHILHARLKLNERV